LTNQKQQIRLSSFNIVDGTIGLEGKKNKEPWEMLTELSLEVTTCHLDSTHTRHPSCAISHSSLVSRESVNILIGRPKTEGAYVVAFVNNLLPYYPAPSTIDSLPGASWQQQSIKSKRLSEPKVCKRPAKGPRIFWPINNWTFRDAVKTPCCGTAYLRGLLSNRFA
jgi:hypothetical protein